MSTRRLLLPTICMAMMLLPISLFPGASSGSVQVVPAFASQSVQCNLVDTALSMLPPGDGDGVITNAELGPGRWRFNRFGQSFVTFAYFINGAGDGYNVIAGRSNLGANAGIINDYPDWLDLPQAPSPGALVFSGPHGVIVLTGDPDNDPPLFRLPGKGAGEIRINVTDTDGDGTYEGCAKSPLLRNFGVVRPEGGDFVQREYFKASAMVDSTGKVTFFEWTEVSTFHSTVPGLY